ncbi:hypothetical protein GCM10011344_19940 [Dokdonia pacifica]|uniref:Uncharacterized protein n=1 Tax=Dokdonia pacifica TaxID=1627892 RepID=A0A238VP31_9FLAO|nr:hypothetical protein [Dokdonia pacifica]GGG19313.1 hypothetical protein GCM10011344_19940 [Dokdonia pacifica]SNR36112.1 hypothetical protein SAMN06265376_101139 [Dokdonia pacifica]
MKEIAKYYISDKFIITGRGLIFAGHILEGQISLDNLIKFCVDNRLIVRKIIGIDEIRHSIHDIGVFDKLNIGLLIECTNEEEMQQIRNSGLKDVEVLIFES